MKVKIITEFRKNLSLEHINEELSSDHLSKEAIDSIASAIAEAGYETYIFGGIPDLAEAYSSQLNVNNDDLYFNISNGMTQPSRRMQAPILCEMLGMNYSGSAPSAVALMNNKYFTKKVIKDLVRTPEDVFINDKQNLAHKIEKIIKYPVIAKPNGEGGSYGIDQESVVYNKTDATVRTRKLLEIYPEIILEEFIPGTEITNLLIGNKNNYRLNEIIVYKTYGKFAHDNLVRDNKIKTQNISEMYPISSYTSNSHLIIDIKKTSVSIFEKLGCRDIARIDYKIDPSGKLFFLEINSNPNLYAKYIDVICEKNGLKYSEFLSLIIKSACDRYHIL